jgi:hypothetical protein
LPNELKVSYKSDPYRLYQTVVDTLKGGKFENFKIVGRGRAIEVTKFLIHLINTGSLKGL